MELLYNLKQVDRHGNGFCKIVDSRVQIIYYPIVGFGVVPIVGIRHTFITGTKVVVLSCDFRGIGNVGVFGETGCRCGVHALDHVDVQSGGAEERAATSGEENGVSASVG